MYGTWQPIETAPESGFVLICSANAGFENRKNGVTHPEDYDHTVATAWRDKSVKNGWIIAYAGELCDTEIWVDYVHEATHWMPLPAPPSEITEAWKDD